MRVLEEDLRWQVQAVHLKMEVLAMEVATGEVLTLKQILV
jgi:hypothetical protein